jgi:hypothetical protein
MERSLAPSPSFAERSTRFLVRAYFQERIAGDFARRQATIVWREITIKI